MRPYWIGIHSKQGNSNKCSVAPQPENRIPELKGGFMLCSIALMKVNICWRVSPPRLQTYGHSNLRKCHSLVKSQSSYEGNDYCQASMLADHALDLPLQDMFNI